MEVGSCTYKPQEGVGEDLCAAGKGGDGFSLGLDCLLRMVHGDFSWSGEGALVPGDPTSPLSKVL